MLSVQCASSLISWLPDRQAAMLHRHAKYCRPPRTSLSVSPHAGPATDLSVLKCRVQCLFVKQAPCQAEQPPRLLRRHGWYRTEELTSTWHMHGPESLIFASKQGRAQSSASVTNNLTGLNYSKPPTDSLPCSLSLSVCDNNNLLALWLPQKHRPIQAQPVEGALCKAREQPQNAARHGL